MADGVKDIYCVCRRPHENRFMICCDKCNEWFHGDCIGVNQAQSNNILHYYCPSCVEHDPALQIVYGNKGQLGKRKGYYEDPDYFDSELKAKRPAPCTSVSVVASTVKGSFSQPQLSTSGSKPCGHCICCYRPEDCGDCTACKGDGDATANSDHPCSHPIVGWTNSGSAFRSRSQHLVAWGRPTPPTLGRQLVDPINRDMKKFGGPGRLRGQRCEFRRCIYMNAAAFENNSFSSLPDLKPVVKPTQSSNSFPSPLKVKNVKNASGTRRGRPTTVKDKVTRVKKESLSPSVSASPGRKRGPKPGPRRSTTLSSDPESNEGEAAAPVKLNQADFDYTRQCYGPQCHNPARRVSKYCSDKCGKEMARQRILTILPGRIQEWTATASVAEERNKQQLEELRDEQKLIRQRLAELDSEEKYLSQWIQEMKKVLASKDYDGPEDADESEQSIFCVTCGHEVSMKVAIRHMTKCFGKLDSMMSYGTSLKAGELYADLLCEEYNKPNKIYCKRLKVMCPEHSKDPKIEDWEICGAPLSCNTALKEGFTITNTCLVSKKRCSRHYKWEKIRRALIDAERINYLTKLDHTVETEQNIKQNQLVQRGNLIALLTHSTTDHTVLPTTPQQFAALNAASFKDFKLPPTGFGAIVEPESV